LMPGAALAEIAGPTPAGDQGNRGDGRLLHRDGAGALRHPQRFTAGDRTA
jgi:hypothetical protein